MPSIFPIITVTDLRHKTKAVLDSLKDYVVVQNHGKDVAMILHPDLGLALIKSGELQELLARGSRLRKRAKATGKAGIDFEEFDRLIGQVIRELSKQ